jgi:hypothetical protein
MRCNAKAVKEIRMKRNTALPLALLLALGMLFTAALPAFGQRRISGPFVIPETKHDVSPPVRDLATALAQTKVNKLGALNPNHVVRVAPGTSGALDIEDNRPLPNDVATTNLLNFDGLAAAGFAPPDTNGSVGSTQFVETVNLNYAVYDKTTGGIILGPTAISTIWSGFGGSCALLNSQSDPIVLWDKMAQRWFISILAFNATGTQFTQCFAVSKTADATGSYNRYSFSFGTNLNDFPKFGVWSDAYYGSYDIFPGGVSYAGTEACAYDRTAMLAGTTAKSVCFNQTVNDFALLPSDLDGTTAPPAGEPNLYVEHIDTANIGLFKFHVDFVNTGNSTFTGPTVIPVKPWIQLCPGTRVCIPEPSPGEPLDPKGDRLHYRNAYRNFGNHETLVLTHAIDKGTGVAEVRWYELRNPNGTPRIFQSGNIAAKPNLWVPSIAMDKLGDIAVSYNSSSSLVKPSVIYTGRLVSDQKGKMETPFTAVKGTGVQTATSNRWGDYASMSIDPSDDCTFWSAQEYIKTTGSFHWATRITKFKFTACN